MAQKSNKDNKGKSYDRNNKRQHYGKKGSRSDGASRQSTEVTNEERMATKEWGRGAVTNSNHIEWYTPNQTMLNDVASIPFNYRTGDPMGFGTGIGQKPFVMPGVISLKFAPTMGNTVDNTSPINVATNIVYARMRKANSGARNYEGVDMMMQFTAMDSIYMAIAFIKRALAATKNYAFRNTYTPKQLINAMGIVYDDNLIGNMPRHRSRLNMAIRKAQTLAVPAIFPMFERHSYMCTNIYTDMDSGYAQYFVFSPRLLYKFGYNEETGKGELYPIRWSTTGAYSAKDKLRPIDEYLDILDMLIEAVYTDQDAGIISGDVLKAFDNIFTIAEYTESDTLEFAYDSGMLSQIHNATICGLPAVFNDAPDNEEAGFKDWTITQEIYAGNNQVTTYLKQQPTFHPDNRSTTVDVEMKQMPLDLHEQPDPEKVMRATRLMATGTTVVFETADGSIEYKGQIITYDYMPSEVVTEAFVITANDHYSTETGYGVEWQCEVLPLPTHIGRFILADIDDWNIVLNRLITFSYAPIYSYPDEGGWTVAGNLKYLTRLDVDNIRQLHQVAQFGLWNIDQV